MPDTPIIFDDITIDETAIVELDLFRFVDVFDTVNVFSTGFVANTLLDFEVFDEILLLVELTELGFTPKFIDVGEDISVDEDVSIPFDFTEEGINVDDITVTEVVTVTTAGSFNDLLRSFPFIQTTKTGFIDAEFESGVIQERDTWGRKKKVWEVNFPPMTIQEANAVEAFYEVNKGINFEFTHPWQGTTFNVRIVDDDFILNRDAFSTFYARMVIEEVF